MRSFVPGERVTAFIWACIRRVVPLVSPITTGFTLIFVLQP